LGVSDEYNLCNGTLDEVYSVCKEIERIVLIPSLMEPPADFEMMADAYGQGTNFFVRWNITTKEALVAFVFNCMGLVVPRLSVCDYVRCYFLKCIFFLIYWCPYFEKMSNYFIRKLYHATIHLVCKENP